MATLDDNPLGTAPAAVPAALPLASRVADLERIYRQIGETRMAGLGLCHPELRVAAVAFEHEPDSGGAVGVLVTPWFMNLLWLPEPAAPRPSTDRDRPATPPPPLGMGKTRARRIGQEVIDFIGAHELEFGPFEACSLFSPMFEFADQAAAVATAEAVLELLRQPPATGEPGPEPGAAPSATHAEPAPARRAFLLGRRAA